MDSSQSTDSPLNFIVGLIVIAAVVAVIVWLVKRAGKKNLAAAWTGKVVKKSVIKDYGEEVGEVTVSAYRLKVQLDDGTHKDVRVLKDLYDSVAEGDTLVKTADEEYPKKA